MKKESIVGKTYIASDNSYSLNLSNPGKNRYLAGNNVGEKAKETIIVSELYDFTIVSNIEGNPPKSYKFVNVKLGEEIIRVLFYERNVNVNLGIRLERNEELHRNLRWV